jgi:F-type H+-transporting ATPase subunit gamma
MSGQAIRRSIAATDKIRKITRAMQLVSANHLAQATHQEKNSKPYLYGLLDIISYWMIRRHEKKHPYFIASPLTCQLVVVYASDRGLCGALNLNTFKAAVEKMSHDALRDNIQSSVIALGDKALEFFGRNGMHIEASVTKLGLEPRLEQLKGVLKIITDGYYSKRWQKVLLVYPKFINTMSQKPCVSTLLPITDIPRPQPQTVCDGVDYIYEPGLERVMEVLLENYVDASVYQAALETVASEQASRMVAMQNATENAEECKKDLELRYHKARQAAITQEIAEITAGSEAL